MYPFRTRPNLLLLENVDQLGLLFECLCQFLTLPSKHFELIFRLPSLGRLFVKLFLSYIAQ